jgi:hypothetical protein
MPNHLGLYDFSDDASWTRAEAPDIVEQECHRRDRLAPAGEIRKAIGAAVAAERGDVFSSRDVERIAKSVLDRLPISFDAAPAPAAKPTAKADAPTHTVTKERTPTGGRFTFTPIYKI